MPTTEPKRPRRPKAPTGLRTAGRSMWRALHDEYQFEVGEARLVELACRQADDLHALEEALAEQGPTVAGSKGQPRLNPLVPEIRQARAAVARLLGQLALPDDEGKPRTAAANQARRAARARWGDPNAAPVTPIRRGGRRGA